MLHDRRHRLGVVASSGDSQLRDELIALREQYRLALRALALGRHDRRGCGCGGGREGERGSCTREAAMRVAQRRAREHVAQSS
jgi:hypothetical protein